MKIHISTVRVHNIHISFLPVLWKMKCARELLPGRTKLPSRYFGPVSIPNGANTELGDLTRALSGCL